MLPVRKFTLNTKVSWARDVRPDRVQKCVAEGEAESTPYQLEARAQCLVNSAKAGVCTDTTTTLMELPLRGELLWLDGTMKKNRAGDTNRVTEEPLTRHMCTGH